MIFLIFGRSRPIDHPFISKLEVSYLSSKNKLVRESLLELERKSSKTVTSLELKSSQPDEQDRNKTTKKKVVAPWAAILTSVPVWAFVVTKFCVKLGSDAVSIELPTYLKRVMHFSAKDNGLLNGWNYVIFCFSCFGVGALAKVVIKRRPFGMNKTVIRKIFQCTGSFGVAICFVCLAFSVCDSFWTQFALLSMFFITTFCTGGEAQIPLDITDRYSGTIHALGSSIAITGALEPTLVGFLLQGRGSDKESWKLVWLGAGAVSFLGGLVFLLFADASVQPFNDLEPKSNKDKAQDKSKVQVNETSESELDQKSAPPPFRESNEI